MTKTANTMTPSEWRARLIIPTDDGDRPFGEVMAPFQGEMFAALDELGPDGWRWSALFFELHRGASKTFVCAVYALQHAFFNDDARVDLAATDREQAGIALAMVRGLLRLNPWLGLHFTVRRDLVRNKANRSEIHVLAADAEGAWGRGGEGKSYVIIADELMSWKDSRTEQLFAALVSATAKKKFGRLICATTTGQKDTLAFRIREIMKADPDMFYLAPRGLVAPWMKPSRVSLVQRLLPAGLGKRLFGEGDWEEDEDRLLADDDIAAAVRRGWKRQHGPAPAASYVISVDLGEKRDATGISLTTYDWDAKVVQLVDQVKLQGSRKRPVRPEQVDKVVRRWLSRFPVDAIVVDPYGMTGLVARWRDDRIAVHEYTFTQASKERLAGIFMELFANREIVLYRQPDLLTELRGLTVKQGDGASFGWSHPRSGHDDLATSLMLGCWWWRRSDARPKPKLSFGTLKDDRIPGSATEVADPDATLPGVRFYPREWLKPIR